jgi:hypothetical protein
MMKRNEIESLLKINGVTPSSPDEQIRSVLLSARYSKDDVDTAIMVLRENTKTSETRVDGLHKVFRSSQGLRPNEISQLLDIEVNINKRVAVEDEDGNRRPSKFQNFIITILSICVAVLGLAFYMYIYKIGIFYPGVGMF